MSKFSEFKFVILAKSEDYLRLIDVLTVLNLEFVLVVSVLDGDDDDDGGSDGDASDNVIRNILQQAKHEMQTPATNDTCDAPVRQEEEDYGTLEPSVQSPVDFVQSIIQKVKCELDEDSEPSVSPCSISRSFQTLPADPDQRAQVFSRSEENTETRERPRSCPTAVSSSFELQSLDLDTFSITQRVKETLMINNIGLCSVCAQ